MNQILYTFRRTIQHYIDGSFILIAATVIAIIIANSPFSSSYFSFWEQTFSLQIGDFDFFAYKGESMTLMQVINEFLMAIFFFTIGLEIKREILVGELSTMKTALLPIIGAIGGMVLLICFSRITVWKVEGAPFQWLPTLLFRWEYCLFLVNGFPTDLKFF